MTPALACFYWRYVRPLRGEKGATAVEYAIMAVLIAVVIVVAVGLLGEKLDSVFKHTNELIP